MSSSYSILNIGWTAMVTHRLSSDVAGHNMANATTEGYSRQRADLMARKPWLSFAGPMGTGVWADSINRMQDGLLAQRMMDASADLGFGSSRVNVLSGAETVFGIGDDDPVGFALSRFYSSLENLASNPEGMVERAEVLNQSSSLGQVMTQVRQELSQLRSDMDATIRTGVDQIQVRLGEIAALNREIGEVEATGPANDLKDRRELLAKEVAERIDVRVFSDDRGNLNLALAAGGVLVEGSHSATLEGEAQVANSGLLSPVLVSANGIRTVLDESISGSLGGMLAARDSELQQAVSSLDTLAFDLAQQVNNIHASGFGLDGLSNRVLFENIGTVDGAAANLRLDAQMQGQPELVAAALDLNTLPGDNRVALSLAALRETSFMGSGNQTVQEFLQTIRGALGSGLQGAERDTDLHSSRLSQLTMLRESVAGVSIDEEMIELTKAQRAFEAAAKVIKAGDELLEVVLSLK